MFLYNKSRFALFAFFLLVQNIQAGVIYTCDPAEIKNELIELNLDPDITTNEDLLSELRVEYGVKIHALLTEKHPLLLQQPRARFDNKTLQWVIETIWHPTSPSTRYLPLLADLSDDSVIDDYLKTAYRALFISNERTALLFLTQLDFILFELRAETELDRIIRESQPNISEDAIKKSTSIFKEKYLRKENYLVGSFNPNITNPIVIVDGHGMAGKDHIKVGDLLISYRDIVKTLIDIKLPDGALIKLNSCLSGCIDNKLNLTVAQIKYKFQQGTLTTDIGLIHGSFLQLFSQYLFQHYHQFQGTIEGYLGTVFYAPVKNVLRKDGKIMPVGNATKVTGTDGNIRLKKEQSAVQIHRADFPIS